MNPFGEGVRRCKRCRAEISGGVETCPSCNYHPKSKGLRVAMGFYLLVVLSMMGVIVLPPLGRIFVPIAGVSFLLALVVLFIAFTATPHRFGRLFLRL
jgi:hypothetical protein